MPNIEPILLETADAKTRELLESSERRIGRPSNMLRTMAHSRGVLEAYLHFNHVYEQTLISSKLRGLITAAIAQALGGDYILSVAVALGAHQGLSLDEIEAARRGESNDPKIATALQFAVQAVEKHGAVDAALVATLPQAGYSDEETIEIIGLIGLNLFRNYFNMLARTEVDFPHVRTSEPIPESLARKAVTA